ncbi:MAG: ParB N-terminal domain-containing protein [Lachnospiraceae bacterium]|nr:ParB N-terminal domain-containing protein [Lachnospiraceae bacterium]
MAGNKIIGLNEIFGIPDSQFEIVEIPIQDLVPYKNHKFRPSSPAKRDIIAESIKEFGVLSPIIVRPKEDCAYEINGRYEILAGHQRTELSRQVGKTNIPAIIKNGLTEEEAEQIVDETNIQRSLEEMTYSERAAVLSSHYNAMKKRNVRKEVLSEINSYLQTYANPLNIRAEQGLSPGGTAGVREVADDYDLSKNTIARYIRVDTLIDGIKFLLDDGEIPFKASVELSYISTGNQELLAELINSNEYKCDINKAKLIRELQMKNKLTIATMTEVLSGKKVKRKPGAPKGYKVSGKVIQKYFKPEQDDKEIGEIIEKALELYFEEGGSN